MNGQKNLISFKIPSTVQLPHFLPLRPEIARGRVEGGRLSMSHSRVVLLVTFFSGNLEDKPTL